MEHPAQFAPLQPEEGTLRDYLEVVLRRWKLACLVFAVVFLGVVLYTYTREPVYQAVATLQVEVRGGVGVLGTLEMGNRNTLATDMEILRSRTIAEKVAQRLHLDGRSTALRIQQGLQVREVGRGTNVIELSFQANDPVRAREVVNALAEVYQEQSIAHKSQEATKTIEFIDAQLEGLRSGLESSEKALREYQVHSGLKVLGPEAEALVQKLIELEGEKRAIDLRTGRLKGAFKSLQAALARGTSYLPAALPDLPLVGELVSELTDLDAQRRSLLADYTDDHPAVRVLQGRIDNLQVKISSAFTSALQDLALQKGQLDRELAAYDEQMKKMPESELELARLVRQAKLNAESYTFLLEKREEARIAKAVTSSHVNVIDPAVTPERPIKPNKRKNLTLGMVLGLMLGIGLVFFLEHLDDTVRDGEHAKKLLGWPVLATIPFVGRECEGARSERALALRHDPKAPAAEAFRSLRTALHYSAVNREKRVYLVTSAFPDEGKTTVSANLAATLAQIGKSVVLVGCDLRKPTLHHLFEAPLNPGLTELLAGDAAVEQVVRPTDIDGLHFIGGGAVPPNPAELLGSPAMEEVVEQLRDRYDHVVFDAPPVLAVTDAPLLAALSDRVLVVLESGRVPVKAAQLLGETLAAVEAPVAGLVLNDKAARGGNYGRYYGGYYGEDAGEATTGFWRRFRWGK